MFDHDNSETSWLIYADWLQDQDIDSSNIREELIDPQTNQEYDGCFLFTGGLDILNYNKPGCNSLRETGNNVGSIYNWVGQIEVGITYDMYHNGPGPNEGNGTGEGVGTDNSWYY
jgi:uncharacterized protein (TIGR02996 family)